MRSFGKPLGVALAASFLVLASLTACSSGSNRPKPAELPANTAILGVRSAWMVQLPPVRLPLQVHVAGSTLTVAASDGTVAAIDADSGRELWRTSLGVGLTAGVGSDGKTTAVVARTNEVIAVAAGKEQWRYQLPAQVQTAPLVAGERVFILAADRSVTTLDAKTGRRLWVQQRPTGDALVLNQPGVLLAVGDTLVVGLSNRLTGLNPLSGSTRWETPIGTVRGSNDVERLVDLVGPASRSGTDLCVRAFQLAVGCVNAQRGTLLWSKPANGFEGVQGDETMLYGSEGDGKLVAWKRADGERAWSSDRLLYRRLTAPLALGRSIVVGDHTGLVHLLSREDGSPLNRLNTDGSPIAATPVVAADTLVVVTEKGAVFGFRPE